jgi:hypothetical protein
VTPDDDYSPVFIVRIWRELRDTPGAPPEWRGRIEHLQSHRQAYFNELEEVLRFITPYLEKMRVAQKVGRGGRGFIQRLIAAIQGKRVE